jgi:23S rRNA pseudouridine2457 synthase
MLIAFNKPYGVLSQFSGNGSPNRTLAEFGFPKNVYPIGRLDADSEGLLLLSDEPEWNKRLLHPHHAHEREYWAQVERIPTPEALKKLARGVLVQGRKTLPCRAWILEPQLKVVQFPSPDLAATLSPPSGERVGARGKPQIRWGESLSSPNLKNDLRSTESRPTKLANHTAVKIPSRNPPIRFRKNVPDCWIGLELIEGKNHQVRRMTAAIGHPTLRLIRVRIGNFRLGDLPAGQWRILDSAQRRLVMAANH